MSKFVDSDLLFESAIGVYLTEDVDLPLSVFKDFLKNNVDNEDDSDDMGIYFSDLKRSMKVNTMSNAIFHEKKRNFDWLKKKCLQYNAPEEIKDFLKDIEHHLSTIDHY